MYMYNTFNQVYFTKKIKFYVNLNLKLIYIIYFKFKLMLFLSHPLTNEAKNLYENVKKKNYKEDSGLDLYIIENEIIKPGETKFIKLGIKAEMLDKDNNVGYYLYPRSSISKTPLRMCNSIGLIDKGFRGELMFAVDNIKNYEYEITKGQRLCQIVAHDLSPIVYQVVSKLSESERSLNNSCGFGSTG